MTESLDWAALWDENEQRYRVQTRDGREVTIFTTEARGSWPIVGEYWNSDLQEWLIGRWSSDGSYLRTNDSPKDLVPAPRTVKRWVNVYQHGIKGDYYTVGAVHDTETEAISGAQRGLVATVPIEWEE